MKKMAIFVEGRVEVEIDSKLIEELAAPRAITIKSSCFSRGPHGGRSLQLIETRQTGGAGVSSSHYFMLYNCRGEDNVKSRMLQEYASLCNSGYSKIICHRDLRPNIALSDLEKFERNLPYKVPTKPIAVQFVLSIMEVEAWFLAEHTHFARIDPAISCAAISTALGFDPSTDDMQLRANPADDLGDCYAIAGKQYNKLNTQPTISAIDCTQIFLDVAPKFRHLQRFCDEINDFLA